MPVWRHKGYSYYDKNTNILEESMENIPDSKSQECCLSFFINDLVDHLWLCTLNIDSLTTSYVPHQHHALIES